MQDPTKQAPMVSVLTLVYNHAPYLEDYFRGILMQETTYKYEVIINDDCSTDGSTEIIRRYAEKYPGLIIPVFHGTNQYSKGIDPFADNLLHRAKGKYIALCEGDDFWTDPHKLQKQVDYLEAHPDFILVHSDFTVVNANGKAIKRNGSSKYIISEGNVFEDLFRGCWVRTLTVLYRNNAGIAFPDLPPGCFRGDAFTFYVLARYGKFHFMQEETGAYRILNNSAAHCTCEARRFAFEQSLKQLDYYMAEFYGASPEVTKSLDERWTINEFKHSLYAGDYAYYARTDLSSVKQSRGCLGVGCRLCRCKPLFYLCSAAVRFRIVLMRFLRQL